MTSEEILLAFRLIAMGRPAHDEVKRLAEFLGERPADATPVVVEPAGAPIEVKRTRKKAD